MKAKRIVSLKKGRIEIEEFLFPDSLKENEVLIKTSYTLVSPGTERAWIMAFPNTPRKFPIYLGYSNVGVVEKTGKDIKNFKEGDRVACRNKHCSSYIASEDQIYHVPAGLSLEKAVFFNLGQISLQGVKKAKIGLGDTVVIMGQGIIGNIALQLAKLNGAMPTIVCDLNNERLKISSSSGADFCFSDNFENKVSDVTGGEMSKVVIEATGNSKVIPLAFRLTAKHGRIILLGSPRGESTINFYPEIHLKGISIIWVHEGARLSDLREDINTILTFLAKGTLNVKKLISTIINYTEAPKIYSKIINEPDALLGVIFKW